MPLIANKNGKYNAKCSKCGRNVLKRYMSKDVAESTLTQHERSCPGKGPWTDRGRKTVRDVDAHNLPPRYGVIPR